MEIKTLQADSNANRAVPSTGKVDTLSGSESSDTTAKRNKQVRVLIMVVCTLVLTMAVGYGVYMLYQGYRSKSDEVVSSDGDNEKAAMDKQLESIAGASDAVRIARVGKEYLFEKDIEGYISSQGGQEIEREKVIEELVRQSVVLQAGEDEGWIELTQNVFNNPSKSFEVRSRLLFEIEVEFNKLSGQEGSLLEYIVIWFWSNEDNSYVQINGLEATKLFIKEKLEGLYQRVEAGEISMVEAAEILEKDKSLGNLKPVFPASEFYGILSFPYEVSSVEDVMKSRILGSRESAMPVFDFLNIARQGDLSEVMLGKYYSEYYSSFSDSSEEPSLVDSYYAFYHMKSKIEETRGSFLDWYEDMKARLIVEYY